MPYDMTKPPDAETIQKEAAHWQMVWDQARPAIEKGYQFYTRKYNIWARLEQMLGRETNRPRYTSAKAPSIVDHAVGAAIPMHPRFHRVPGGGTDDDKSAADRIEKGLLAVFADAMAQNMNYATKVNGKELFICNYTQLYTGLDADSLTRPVQKRGEEKEDFQRRESEWQASRYTWNPFRIEVPAPGEVLMDPSRKNPPSAIRHRTYLAYELEALAKRELGREGASGEGWEMTGKDPYESIAVTERWTVSWYALMERSGGRLIVRKPNTWGIQPFKHTFGGSADVPAFWGSADTQPGFRLKETIEQAMLFPIMDTIVLSDQMDISMGQGIIRAMWARSGYDGEVTEAAAQQKNDILTGAKDAWWVEEVPNMPTQGFGLMDRLDSDIEEATYSRLQAGQPQGNMDTATHVIVLSGKQAQQWAASVEQLGQMYSMAGSDVLKLVYMLNRELGYPAVNLSLPKLGNAPLRAADLGKPPQFHVTAVFEQIDPTTQMQQERLAMEQMGLGAASMDHFLAVARRENASEEKRKIFEDKVFMQDPDVYEFRKQNILRAAKFGDLVRQLEQRQAAERMAAMVGPDGESPLFSSNGQQNGSNGNA